MADNRFWTRVIGNAMGALMGVALSLILMGDGQEICIVSHAQGSENAGEVVVEDGAELLTDSEEQALAEMMQGLAEYGNVMFLSVDDNRISVKGYAEAHYHKKFGDQSGILFMIDTNNRDVFLYRCGKAAKKITAIDAKNIAGRVKTDAEQGAYFACAGKAFTQTERSIRGTRVSRITKYTCNICLGLLLAMLINFVAVNVSSKLQRTEDSELLEHTLNQYEFGEASVRRIS